MKKIAKWLALIGLVLVLLVVLAALIVPRWVDVAQYKPQLEARIAEATGRPCALGGELELSLFPHTRLSSSDIRLANPPGFEGAPLLAVRFIEVRLKPMPLLAGKIVVEVLRIDGLRVSLQRDAAGRGNWEGLAKPDDVRAAAGPVSDAVREAAPGDRLPALSLEIDELAVSDASVAWLDGSGKILREVSGIDLSVRDLSLDKPMGIAFSAAIDGRRLTGEGSLGPLGARPERSSIPVDMALNLLETAHIRLSGTLGDPGGKGALVLHAAAEPFSLRRLAGEVGIGIDTADPAALDRLGLGIDISGSLREGFQVDGRIDLDDSRIGLNAGVRYAGRPDLSLAIEIDRIDLDRYLPTRGPNQGEAGEGRHRPPSTAGDSGPQKIDTEALRSLKLAGSLAVGGLTFKRMVFEELSLEVSGDTGVFELSPLSAKLYGGRLEGGARVDVTASEPRGRLTVNVDSVQAGPLVRALLKKDVLEGTAGGRATVSARGDRREAVISSLAGNGELVLTRGVIKGIDLAALMRAVEGVFGVAIGQGGDARTEFAELRAPFSIDGGKLSTVKTTLISPALAVTASGTADLAAEVLDFRIVPQVAYAPTAGDGEKGRELRLPLLVQGPFGAPVWYLDVGGVARDQLEQRVLESGEFKKLFENEALKPFERSAGKLLKGILSR
jgi:AsmA protein